jgi:N-acetylglucosaminyldiphosphoundecaprenol N-acetyl-beta-D-mannosaminyltransferase
MGIPELQTETSSMNKGVTIPPAAARVLGVPIWGLRIEEAVDLAVCLLEQKSKVLFTTANAHSIVTANRNPAFMAHFQEADLVLPDGMLPVLAARLRGRGVPERVPGPDFASSLIARAESHGFSVFFIGATDEVLDRIRSNCQARRPNLKIAGTFAPPFGEFDEPTNLRLVREINAAAPDILFVGMTAPKQELWLSRNFKALDVHFALGIGAAFDYMAGVKKRAPGWIGRWGFEWLYRLLREPRRLWRRNLDSLVFIWLLAIESIAAKTK